MTRRSFLVFKFNVLIRYLSVLFSFSAKFTAEANLVNIADFSDFESFENDFFKDEGSDPTDFYVPDEHKFEYKRNLQEMSDKSIKYRMDHGIPVDGDELRKYQEKIMVSDDEIVLPDSQYNKAKLGEEEDNESALNIKRNYESNELVVNSRHMGFSHQRGLTEEWNSIAFQKSTALSNPEPDSSHNSNSKAKAWGPNDPDYMWYDPYETESLFTDFTKYVTELHAEQQNEGKVFNNVVYYSRKPWLVIFYAHWCGHCQAYAPKFKEFVRFIFARQTSWKSVLNIGTVNCGSNKESKVCRQQLISAYPRIRYYRAWLSPKKEISGDMRRGLLHTGSKSPNELLKSTLKFLIENSEYQDKYNKGWRVHWKKIYKSGQPAPILDLQKSTALADRMVSGDYTRRATRYVVILYHSSPASSQIVVMGMANYRGITILFKQNRQSYKNFAMIYEYCQPPRKINFIKRDQILAELTRLEGISLDVDKYDGLVQEGLYPPMTMEQCAANGNQPDVNNVPVPELVEEEDDDDDFPMEKPQIQTTSSSQSKDVNGPRIYPSNDHAEALSKIVSTRIPTVIGEYPEKRIHAITFLKKIVDLRV